MSENTKIHGIGAAENIDSSGEKINLANLDCNSLDKGDGTFTFEHSGTEPSKVLGKILKYKKIFSEKDCETPEHLYFWQKAGCPILYIMGELFDGDGHLQANEVASIFRYDARQKNDQTSVPPTMWFSVEGSILNKEPEGGVKQITDAICRLVTITVKPCNRICVAELYEPKEQVAEEDPLAFLKSEIPYIALTKSLKPILEFLPADHYHGFTAEDHVDAAEAHYQIAAHSKGKVFEYHMAKSEEHVELKKALTGGGMGGAPGTQAGGAVLQKEKMRKKIDAISSKVKNLEKMGEYISKKYKLNKSEGIALAKMIAYRKMKRASKA